MDRRIKSIVIVGGGTAGWLSAAYLQRALAGSVQITLVESSDIGRIGVGEATVPSMRSTLEFLGVDEAEWMPECNATFKSAILFEDWARPPAPGARHTYYHPFFFRPEQHIQPWPARYFPLLGEGISLVHVWLKRKLEGRITASLASTLSGTPALCDSRKAPRRIDDPLRPEPGKTVRYAYHLDAGLFAGFLRKLATGRGVAHVVDHIESVSRDERGFLTSVSTRSGRRIAGDLFIDCSGFAGLLINKTLDEPFCSDAASLLCDSAVAFQVDRPEDAPLDPFTRATAMPAGWCWDIPLFHRSGNGYVYCSAFLSRDAAEAELRRITGASDVPANHIRIRVGRNRNTWVKNCVAIGLAASFLEPLESTGIYLIETALATLVTLFPDRDFAEPPIARYNQVVKDTYEELRDFIVLHYITTQRTDTEFWKAVRETTRVPDTLREKLELFEHCFPVLDQMSHRMFGAPSYACILAGMDRLPKRPYPLLEHFDEAAATAMLENNVRVTEQLLQRLPDHRAYLREQRQRPAQTK